MRRARDRRRRRLAGLQRLRRILRKPAHELTAVDRIIAGLEKKNRVINSKEKEIVAYHETGHALAAAFTPGADRVSGDDRFLTAIDIHPGARIGQRAPCSCGGQRSTRRGG